MPLCPKCLKPFRSVTDLQRHLDRKFPCDAGEEKCSGCAQSFSNKQTLKVHHETGACKGKPQALVAQELAHENATLRSQLEQQSDLLQITQLTAQTDELQEGEPDEQLADEAPSSSDEGPSQPPVDNLPTIVDKSNVYEFGNYNIRKTGETPQRVSVYDFIVAITEDTNYRVIFMRLKQRYPEIITYCNDYKFPGRGRQTSPATNARGVVMIVNLLPGRKAALFRMACADIIVRYLGGDETLIGEIHRNHIVQETATDTNPLSLFGDSVASSVKFHETSSLHLASVTNIIDFRSPQVYTRQIFDRVSNVHPVGRPQEVVSAEELAGLSVVKIGSQGNNTGRQLAHTTNFAESKLLDSKLTSSYTHAEAQAKDIWKNNGELYEGLFEGKTTRDTELLLVRDQQDYERQLKVYHQLCPVESTSLELQLAQEKSKQVEAEARKAEADARRAEADARKVEADARKVEADLETLKFKIAHGICPFES